MTPEIALLGDSIFDNKNYTEPGQAVTDCLKRELKTAAVPVLYAVGGSVTALITDQIDKLSAETSHIFISSGGNEGLRVKPLLNVPNQLETIAVIQQGFRTVYSKLLKKALATGLPVTVCSIYDKSPAMEPWQLAALAVFNDGIIREAVSAGISIIDLRAVCTEAEDYSSVSPIEPSGQGSAKIAAVIRKVFEDKTNADYPRVYK